MTTGVIIPNNGDIDEVLTVQIKRNTYDFRFRWNSLEGAWYMYVGLNGNTPKVKFKIVGGYDLLAPFSAYDEVPSGSLFLLDMDSLYGRPSRDNFLPTERFRLYYIESDDLLYDPSV